MPHLRLPDVETAENALKRTADHHRKQAKAAWRGLEWIAHHSLRAQEAERGLLILKPDDRAE